MPGKRCFIPRVAAAGAIRDVLSPVQECSWKSSIGTALEIVHVVNAVVDEELGHRGQALFIVPGGTPGLDLVRKLDKLGCRASHTTELKFNGVRVPAANLLGGQEKLETQARQGP